MPRLRTDVRIEIKQDEEGWWGLIYLFPDYAPNEPPLLVGPCEDEESARERAHKLARDVAPPERD